MSNVVRINAPNAATKEVCECGLEKPEAKRHCPRCQADIGFPNVRQAESEAPELDVRFRDAVDVAKASGVSDVFENFRATVDESHAVIARSINRFYTLFNDRNQLLNTFYKEVAQDSRVAENNYWDKGREAADSTILPGYHKEIGFAALSLTDIGIPKYGNCHAVLRTEHIRNRTTTFEENPFVFNRKHHVVAGDRPPKGYRSTWDRRADLAASKLVYRLASDTPESEFPSILLCDDNGCDDFVEVHIYGSLHPSNFKKLTPVGDLSAAELVIFEDLKKRFEKATAEEEIV